MINIRCKWIAVILTVILLIGCVNTTYASERIVVTNSYANVRSAAGANNQYLGKVYKGQEYDVLTTGNAPNGKKWIKINYNGKDGWVCSSFVSYKNGGSDDTKKNLPNQITVTGNPVMIRKGAGKSNAVITKTSKGKVFDVVDSAKAKDGMLWYKIKLGENKYGWIISTLVRSGGKTSADIVPIDNKHGTLIGTFTATAYCGIEGGGENYYTANGYCLKGKSRIEAKTIAVDPRKIKLGTKLYIEFPSPYQHFNGIYYARDTGGAIKGNKIDLYIGYSNLKDAYNFGVRKGVKVYYA